MSVQRVFRGRALRATSTHASASTEPSPGVRAKGSPPTPPAPRAGFVLTLRTPAILDFTLPWQLFPHSFQAGKGPIQIEDVGYREAGSYFGFFSLRFGFGC
jgi:hypothetical protein